MVEDTINLLLELKKAGVSMLVITHDLYVVKTIADKIVFFSDGKTICEVTRNQFEHISDFSNLPPYAKLLFESLPANKFIDIEKIEKTPTHKNSLEAKNISFGYSKNSTIFRNLNFKIVSGEIVGFRAHSGFWKSTLCKLLTGYLEPNSGEILINNESIKTREGYSPVQFIFQHCE